MFSFLLLEAFKDFDDPEKVINVYIQRGEFEKIVTFAEKVDYHVDFEYLLQQLVRNNPSDALEFAKKLTDDEAGVQVIDKINVMEIFMSVNLLRETTAFLLEALKRNRKEEGFLQTKLLEINFLGGLPQVADAILLNEMFTYYDRPYIGRLCEQAGLAQRALDHYTDIADIKRVLQSSADQLIPEKAVAYFESISKDRALEVLRDLLARNSRMNLQLVIQIATTYSDRLGAENLIHLLEDFRSFEGLFAYLGSIINYSPSPLVHYKYIEAAARMQNLKEVERVCRESTIYVPVDVKNFLVGAKLQDPRSLIHVCDRFGFIDDLTTYLYTNNWQNYIEVYVQKVSPQKTVQVVGKLLDFQGSEELIHALLNSVGPLCPVAELVDQVGAL